MRLLLLQVHHNIQLLCVLYFFTIPTYTKSSTILSLSELFKRTKNLHNNKEGDERNLKKKVLHRYKLLKAKKINELLQKFKVMYPEFVKLHSAQELYGFPSLGEVDDCPFDHDGTMQGNSVREEDKIGCKNWILTIEDTIAHPVGSDSYKKLPEVFISGTMHGDETVGPSVAMEVAELLLEAAYCESLPRGIEPPKETEDSKWTEWEDELKDARRCRIKLKENSISDVDRKWLARLVTTRRIVIVPTTNALGYFRETHKEDGLDPKDDFPFENKDPADCMQTIGARTVNELYRSHLFQISLSFHSGTELIGYPWGSHSFLHDKAPDVKAMTEMADEFAEFAGPLQNEYYPTGIIDDVYGPHRGRFEDWAYGASWLKNASKVSVCNPYTYGGYDQENTVYSESMLRSISMMIHTSEDKAPEKTLLGTSYGLMNPKSALTGVIPRNMRLTLMAIDIVQPYAVITHVNGMTIQDDIVPRAYRNQRTVITTKAVNIPQGTEFINMEWIVGGGFTIDSTSLFYAKWTELPPGFDGVSQPSAAAIQAFYISDNTHEAPGGRGKTRWDTVDDPYIRGPDFTSAFDVFDFKEGDEIAVFAVAQLDKKWKNDILDGSPNPNVPPQSHLVNARTSMDWYHENDDKIIEGRLQYFSTPLTLVIGPPKSVTHELSQRISGHHRTEDEIEEIVDISFVFMGFAITCIALATLNFFKAKQEAMKKQQGASGIDAASERPSTRPYVQVMGDFDADDNDQEIQVYPAYTDYTDKNPKSNNQMDDEEEDDSDDDGLVEESIIELM